MASDWILKTLPRQPSLLRLRYPFIAFAISLTLASCMDASTLGAQAPDHVVINGTPSWDNGIKQLMNTKCATCHQVPRLLSSPQNVPTDLDLRYETTSGAIRAGEDIAAQIKLGILKHGIVYKPGVVTVSTMPLSFGTPLYTDEITAMETWANDVVAKSTSIADGALLYKRHCQACHGMYGAGGLVQRSVIGRSGGSIANAILNTSNPMNKWPELLQLANECKPTVATSTCIADTTLSKIETYLKQ